MPNSASGLQPLLGMLPQRQRNLIRGWRSTSSMMIYPTGTIRIGDARLRMMTKRRIAQTLADLRRRGVGFFWIRCGAGLPWFWPAQPPGNSAMVQARRLVRWHFGRDHPTVSRKLAQVLVTLAWPLAVFANLSLVWK